MVAVMVAPTHPHRLDSLHKTYLVLHPRNDLYVSTKEQQQFLFIVRGLIFSFTCVCIQSFLIGESKGYIWVMYLVTSGYISKEVNCTLRSQ